MRRATLVWTLWQALLQPFAWAFTRPGFRRFAEWVTALALNVEEHTITQSVTAIDRVADWKALETFAEYGSWRADYVTTQPDPAGRGRPRSGLARLPRLGRRRHQGPPLRRTRLGHLHVPRVHRPLPEPGGDGTGEQLGRRRGLACGTRTSRPGSCRSPGGFTSASRSCPSLPSGRPSAFRPSANCPSVAPRTRPALKGFAPGRLRRRLRLAERGAAVGPARGRRAAGRVPDPAAAGRPAVRLAAEEQRPGAAGPRGCPSGAKGCRRPARAVAGPRGWQTGGAFGYGRGGRCVGRRWCACGGCSATPRPSQGVVAKGEGYRSGSPWSVSAPALPSGRSSNCYAAASDRRTGSGT